MPKNENNAIDWIAVPRTEPDDEYTPRPARAWSDLTAEYIGPYTDADINEYLDDIDRLASMA